MAILPAVLALLGQDEGATPAPAPRPQTAVAAAPLDVAAIDAMFASSWAEKGIKPGSPASDAEWLRRASLSLNGIVPSALEAAEFLKSADPDKRAKKVDEMLGRPDYAKHFGGEWTRLMIGRSGRAERIVGDKFENWVEDQFTANVPFHKFVTDVITATGPLDENPATGFVSRWMQMGGGVDGPKDLAGQTSKVFLGVQIQCARCHDHKYEQWKQEEFNEFASFFATTAVDRRGDRMNPSVMDRPEKKQSQFVGRDARERNKRLLKGAKDPKAIEALKKRQENLDLAMVRPAPLRPLETGPFAMPLTEPAPVPVPVQAEVQHDDEGETRFDVDMKGTQVSQTRRQRLAAWMTSPGNPYFARAIVNRTYAALFGYGLVEPIDDFRSDSAVAIPPLLDALARDFERSGYDFKRLVSLLARSRAFNLESGAKGPTEKKETVEAAEHAFARFPARPMTVDQLFASIIETTGVAQAEAKRTKDPEARGKMREAILKKFVTAFDDDEQNEGIDFEGTIPAALLMMNGEVVQRGITRGATIQRAFSGKSGNGEKIDQLYLAALGRKPTTEERSKAVLFVGKGGDRREAFEDLLWALLNSSEFSTVH